jgi:hypothetical protein
MIYSFIALLMHAIALFLAAAGGYHLGKDKDVELLLWLIAILLTVFAMWVAP